MKYFFCSTPLPWIAWNNRLTSKTCKFYHGLSKDVTNVSVRLIRCSLVPSEGPERESSRMSRNLMRGRENVWSNYNAQCSTLPEGRYRNQVWHVRFGFYLKTAGWRIRCSTCRSEVQTVECIFLTIRVVIPAMVWEHGVANPSKMRWDSKIAMCRVVQHSCKKMAVLCD